MIIFYCVLGLGLGGIGYVLWNLKNETEHQSLPVEKIDPNDISSFGLQENLNPGKKNKLPAKSSKPTSKPNFSLSNITTSFQNTLKRIKPAANKDKQAFDLKTEETFLMKDKFSQNPFNIPNQKPIPLNSVNPATNAAPTTNAVPTANPVPTTTPQPTFKPLSPKQLNSEEIKKIEAEIDLSTELKELKTKHERLEKIFQERNAEFEKNQEELNNELKNRKEFNKIKDLLEKELKDTKNQSRDAQTKLNLVMAEMEAHKKRNDVLEEKVTKLEKDILKKEEEIDTLVKRLQTFASPTTSTIPPKRDLPSEKTPQPEAIISELPASETSKPIEIVPEQIILTPAIEINQPIIPEAEVVPPTNQNTENIVKTPSNNPPAEPKNPADQISLNEPASAEEIPFLKLNPDVTENHEPPKEQT